MYLLNNNTQKNHTVPVSYCKGYRERYNISLSEKGSHASRVDQAASR